MSTSRTIIPALARAAIRRAVAADPADLDRLKADAALPQHPHGVFVTLKTSDEEVRGCIGRVERSCDDLADEIVECAVLAATQDPRFPPVCATEVDDLRIEVSLLGEFERVNSVADLDPERFGVLVRAGRKRGLLLPGLAGISTPEQHLAIARDKGGISANAKVEIYRFGVEKYAERNDGDREN